MSRWTALRPESDHLLHLDALRLVAASGIVALHLSEKLDAPGWDKTLANVQMFSLFVDLFFIISGFVIAFVAYERMASVADFGRFMQRRVARLVPLHWATLAFFVLLGLVSSALHVQANHGDIYDMACLPANLLLLHATGLCPHPSFNGASWSISAEMVMYLLSPLIFWLLRRSAALLLCAMGAAWVALTLYDYHLGATWNDWLWPNWATRGEALRALPPFLYGAWLYGVRQHLPRWRLAPVLMWLPLLGFVAGCLYGLPILYLLLCIYATVSLAVIADRGGSASSRVYLLAAGGQLTYSSYMLHPVIAMVLVSVLAERILHLQGTWKNLAVLACFCAVWPISYLSLVLFERPLRRRIGGWFRGPKRAENPA